jgi:glutamate receptor, ionotropic, invertebrate
MNLHRYVKFSTPLDEGEWKMIMLRPQESASGAGLLAPFDHIVWYFILVTLIISGPAIWMIIWLYHRFGKQSGEPYYNVYQCIWYVYGESLQSISMSAKFHQHFYSGGLMKQGSVLSPNADSIRVAFATWWIYITILTSFYTANLTAFLTLAVFSLPINVPKDMLDQSKGFVSQKGFAVEYAIKNVSRC